MIADTLDQLTDAELSEVFAVECAEFGPVKVFYEWADRKARKHPMRFHVSSPNRELGDFSAFVDEDGNKFYCGSPHRLHRTPRFATSADAVLPFTDAFPFCDITRESHLNGKPWSVGVARTIEGDDAVIHALAPTWARAICIALIRAKRAEKGAAA
jgi:hypothetical protein